MTKTTASPSRKRRAMPKQDRRIQLIKATISCIANKGLSNITMADITTEAGLSLGIVNLHFQSKNNLLVETLRFVVDEYNEGQAKILKKRSTKTTQEILEDHLAFDFSAKVCQKDKLAVWFGFWGEAKSRPTYQKICAESDSATESSISTLFQEIIEEGNYQGPDADTVTKGYTAIVEGLWLDLLITPAAFNRKNAKRVARAYLAAMFPQHIDL
ncbi:TetR family transcriptional regulator C-terminal domain-containing protein [Dasania sp. GY-MA-18]|uniref:TetR family transcriptional regulator C-terminal domain-containing protein n=1 Tax=Dasania phycosphaerae TaxID=2950436 RepID=A0A9J6RMK5_9GAMM|nr:MULTISPECIES: TetR family transcriptional regulator C-terminal domain-containing protein [Dasania]MCR8923162.1 TetR family transcriptional regulator C-terminal domain-containing protein [Dasania sp. GY-MA-18]MCZ0865594.1 TetR family transcriptional regulator C-terminal domain-containing protein [Dasania phycosphaerae]MCZ0869319.1 TetR family transcriptional regulator C-terminal domain-containing protein [Dasania phycosphaerae]